ncbi:MAG: hypothetical protein LBS19_10120, partial [Clostridiales bacterium]|nr:hypothetical protein [Clostridiales bacterium]
MDYSKEQIVSMVQKALDNPSLAYRRKVFKFRGPRSGERYTEIAAEELLKPENFDKLGTIPRIDREDYRAKSHDGLANKRMPDNSNRQENWIAKRLFGKSFDHIGEFIDFETPLKKSAADSAGKIDLIAHSKTSGKTYMLELKRPESDETLLRCALEIYTYYKTANHGNLLKSFSLPGESAIPGILVYIKSQAYQDFISESCRTVRILMKKLGVS